MCFCDTRTTHLIGRLVRAPSEQKAYSDDYSDD